LYFAVLFLLQSIPSGSERRRFAEGTFIRIKDTDIHSLCRCMNHCNKICVPRSWLCTPRMRNPNCNFTKRGTPGSMSLCTVRETLPGYRSAAPGSLFDLSYLPFSASVKHLTLSEIANLQLMCKQTSDYFLPISYDGTSTALGSSNFFFEPPE
jgi:hypothetical protein